MEIISEPDSDAVSRACRASDLYFNLRIGKRSEVNRITGCLAYPLLYFMQRGWSY